MAILLYIFIFVLVVLFLLIGIVASVLFRFRNLIYKLLGKKVPDPFSTFNTGRTATYNTGNQNQRYSSNEDTGSHVNKNANPNTSENKIFSKDEGEYVDFEEIK